MKADDTFQASFREYNFNSKYYTDYFDKSDYMDYFSDYTDYTSVYTDFFFCDCTDYISGKKITYIRKVSKKTIHIIKTKIIFFIDYSAYLD